MNSSPNLGLPFLAPVQAAKHVIVNEALSILDALVMAVVSSRSETSPPLNTVEGDRYLVPAGATGSWTGQDDNFALRIGAAWMFIGPRPGWRLYVEDENKTLRWSGTAWVVETLDYPDSVTKLGIGGDADAALPLSITGPGAVLSAPTDGPDDSVRFYVNKSDSVATASLLFQDQYSSHAEVALSSENDFVIRISDDGANFDNALAIDTQTGAVSIGDQPNTLYALSVGRDDPAIQGLRVHNLDAGSGAASILRLDAANGHYFNMQLYGSGAGYFYTNASLYIGTYAAQPLHFRTDSVDRLTIHPSGQISIGTPQATAALNVGGALRVAQSDVSALPSASGEGAGAIRYASDLAMLVVSDGTAWQRADGSGAA